MNPDEQLEHAQLPRMVATPQQVDQAMRAMTGEAATAEAADPTDRVSYVEERIRIVLSMYGGENGDPTRDRRLRRLMQELRVEFDTLAAQGMILTPATPQP